MSNMFLARSLIFYPGYCSENVQELSDEIIIPAYYFNRLVESYDDGEPLLVTITNLEKDLSTVVAIGTPHREDRNIVFIPPWILDLIGHEGDGNGGTIRIEKINTDIPVATKIVIKPLDPIAFELDTLACFEKTMMNLHTIREGMTIPVYIPELGADFVMFAYIEKVETASLSRIVDGEVDVEFLNDFGGGEPTAQIDTGVARRGNDGGVGVGVGEEEIDYSTLLADTVSSLPTAAAKEISNEERREQVRNSWLMRFENNAK